MLFCIAFSILVLRQSTLRQKSNPNKQPKNESTINRDAMSEMTIYVILKYWNICIFIL